jgi:hypothetical protein
MYFINLRNSITKSHKQILNKLTLSVISLRLDFFGNHKNYIFRYSNSQSHEVRYFSPFPFSLYILHIELLIEAMLFRLS